MSADKKDYQTVLAALVSHATVASTINKITKIWAATEDAKLKAALGELIVHLKAVARDQSKPNAVGSFQLNATPYKEIARYCQKCVQSLKPQWQIIAEQHGWAPTQ